MADDLETSEQADARRTVHIAVVSASLTRHVRVNQRLDTRECDPETAIWTRAHAAAVARQVLRTSTLTGVADESVSPRVYDIEL